VCALIFALSGDVTRSFQFHAIKLFKTETLTKKMPKNALLKPPTDPCVVLTPTITNFLSKPSSAGLGVRTYPPPFGI